MNSRLALPRSHTATDTQVAATAWLGALNEAAMRWP
jgi:hypothetical protein